MVLGVGGLLVQGLLLRPLLSLAGDKSVLMLGLTASLVQQLALAVAGTKTQALAAVGLGAIGELLQGLGGIASIWIVLPAPCMGRVSSLPRAPPVHSAKPRMWTPGVPCRRWSLGRPASAELQDCLPAIAPGKVSSLTPAPKPHPTPTSPCKHPLFLPAGSVTFPVISSLKANNARRDEQGAVQVRGWVCGGGYGEGGTPACRQLWEGMLR